MLRRSDAPRYGCCACAGSSNPRRTTRGRYRGGRAGSVPPAASRRGAMPLEPRRLSVVGGRLLCIAGSRGASGTPPATGARRTVMSRILLVEDDPDLRLLMEHVLLGGGYEVDTADSVAAAH